MRAAKLHTVSRLARHVVAEHVSASLIFAHAVVTLYSSAVDRVQVLELVGKSCANFMLGELWRRWCGQQRAAKAAGTVLSLMFLAAWPCLRRSASSICGEAQGSLGPAILPVASEQIKVRASAVPLHICRSSAAAAATG